MRSAAVLAVLALCAFVALSVAMKSVTPGAAKPGGRMSERRSAPASPGAGDAASAPQAAGPATGASQPAGTGGILVNPGGRSPGRLASSADSIVMYSVHKFIHSGPNNSFTDFDDTFTPDSIAGWRYVLEVVNGGCSHVWVGVAGQEDIGKNDISSRVLRAVDVYPTPGASNDIWVTLQGSGSCYISMRIVRVKDPTFIVFPPTTRSGPSPGGGYVDTFTQTTGDTLGTLRVVNGDGSGFSRVTGATLKLNGAQVLGTSDFSTGVAIMERQVTLKHPTALDTLILTGEPSSTQMTTSIRVRDITPPVIALNYPVAVDSFVTDSSSLHVSGTVTDEAAGLCSINGGANQPTPGNISATLSLPSDGKYHLSVFAINRADSTTTITRTVIRDTQAPGLAFKFPGMDSTVSESVLTVTGTWADTSRAWITLAGDTVGIGSYGSFSKSVLLDIGSNRIYLDGIDQLGHHSEFVRTLWRSPPTCSSCDTSGRAASLITATEVSSFRNQVAFIFRGSPGHFPLQGGAAFDSTKIVSGSESVIRGFVAGRDYGALPGVSVSVLGHPELGSTTTLNDGWFDLVVNGGATYTLRFDLAGFLEAQRQVIAPALDYALVDTVAMIGRSGNWYYADTSSARMIVGRFEADSNGSRQMYLLVPNGALATVTPASGTPITRDKYRILLKEFTVGSGGPNTMPGELPQTTAYTYCIDMSLVEGDSVSNASAGAPPASITFSKPIVTYVKEFLGLPVGTVMPSGYYDQALGKWVADENGRVIKVLGISGGLANLDTDGDSQADSTAQYASFGIDTLERTQIATQFRAGDVLWRDRVTHFSPHDFNLNIGTNGGLGSSNAANAGAGSPQIGDPNETCGCIIENENRVLGETIPLKGTPFSLSYRSSRQFGDKAVRWIRIPLTGSTVPAGLQVAHVVVDVAGRRFKTNYTGIGANDVRMFTDWDGTDAYGRPVPGSVTATVRIGLEFKQSYSQKTTGQQGFGNSASTPSATGLLTTGDRKTGLIEWSTQRVSVGAPSMGSAGLGGWNLSPQHFYDTSGRGALYLGDGGVRYGYQQNPIIKLFAGNGSYATSAANDVYRESIGISPSAMAFGPDGGLYFVGGIGTGTGAHYMVFRIKPTDGHIIQWAGCTNCSESINTNDPQDGQLAVSTTRRLGNPNGLAVGPDGSLYISDSEWRQVYKVTPDDTLHIVSGLYSLGAGSFVEGAVAKTHALHTPTSVAVGPDGSVFVADLGYKRVVRIGADGLMHSFAGDDSCCAGTSGKADSLMLNSSIRDMVADRQGDVFMADGTNLWMVTPDGQMRTVSAPGHGVGSLATGPDGALYIGTTPGYSGVVRREMDGSLSIIAGLYPDDAGDPAQFPAEEGGFARAARLWGLQDVAVGPDGKLYVSQAGDLEHTSGWGIRMIMPQIPGASAGEIAYPSEDGREAYYFTLTGRHLRTVDVTTGVTLYAFHYDGAGRLISVLDADGDSTTIQRDGSGAPLAIVGPYGQRTKLAHDGNGYLSQVSDSLTGETYTLTNSTDGLLQSFKNPRNNMQTFTYNSDDGRLHYDQDAAGATQTMEHTDGGVTRTVTRTTQEGRATTYQVTQMLDGLRRKLVNSPTGGWSYRADSMNTATSPYGDVIREVGPAGEISLTYPTRDKRFGMLAEVPAKVYEFLRSGVRRTLTASRDTAVSGVITETQGVNGNVATTKYNTSTRAAVTTSQAGRISRDSLDTAGRAIRVTIGDGSNKMDPILLSYDGHGRLTKLEQGGRGWRYSYDDLGRLNVVSDTLHGITTYGYDATDRLTSQTLPGGRTVSYGYDANGNLTSLTPPGNSAHSFAYTVVDLNDTYTPPSVSGISDPATRYTFNGDRQLTKVSRPDGALIDLHYVSSTGLMDSLTQARGRNQFTYSSSGQLQSVTSPDGITVGLRYDGPLLMRESWSGLTGGMEDSVASVANIAFLDSVQTVRRIQR